ncbi:MAG: flagellar biosynthesis anti-sigma factor FlgM [Betaproteobacteria bacterium HGW-Betaproteobacteria-2]|nr:MAG: flagellar biosynthesis anti-sigma factor FlgM [Betaproteobacteria bacterium HGW-Betaproteobacteria-2]
MKIDDALKVNPGLATGNTDAKTAKSTETAKTEQGTSEKVTLSSRSSELQSLETKTVSEEAYDAGKVEAIKAAILDGQFKIDSGKVADGLINTVKDLLSSSKS